MLKGMVKFGLFLVVLLLIYFSLVGAVLLWPEGLFFLSPPNNKLISEKNPQITFNFLPLPGLKVDLTTILLNGESVIEETKVETTIGQLLLKPPSLSEGVNHLKMELEASFFNLVFKKLTFNHSYRLDTTPPYLKLSCQLGKSQFIYVPSSNLSLVAQSEPRTHYDIWFNGRLFKSSRVPENGRCQLKFSLPHERNILFFKLTDEAGFSSDFQYMVEIDRVKPIIQSVFPEAGEVTHQETVTLTARVVEDKSQLAKVVFNLDGQTYHGFYREETGEVFLPQVLNNGGQHRVKLVIGDLAGNQAEYSWSFEIDTTKIVIVRSERRLYLYRDGKLVKNFPVAVGMPGFTTPAGDWVIVSKRRNPVWQNPHLPWSADMPEFIPPGPSNPLGPCAMDLSAPLIRIHGTPSLWSIGHAASHGCIRMYPWDALELFDEVTEGTPVIIR